MIAVAAGYSLSPGEGLQQAVERIRDHIKSDEVIFACHHSHIETIFDYYGPVNAPLIPVDRDDTAAEIRKTLADNVLDQNGFWLFLYKEKDSPLSDVSEDFSEIFFKKDEYEVGKTKVFYFVRQHVK